MSWEAYRWTAKTPAELYHTLGPHGVDDLIRKSLDVCWRKLPPNDRRLAAAQQAAREVFNRNIVAWAKIKTPTPEAFFADLLPNEADHFMRQAMVTCWMMMPRTGGRDVAEVRKIVGEIFQRNMDAWSQDEATFTKTTKRKAARKKVTKAKVTKREKIRKK